MSRLLNPGLGDYADRLTILELKIADAEKKGRSATHFEIERKAVLKHLAGMGRDYVLVSELVDQLWHVNAEIWRGTDIVRALAPQWESARETDVYALAEGAVMLQRLNDRRAELVRLISGPDAPEEKLR